MARETHLEPIAAAMFAGRLGSRPDVREAAEAARAAPAAPQPPRAIDLLLDGLVTRYTEGYSAGLPPLQKAIGAFRDVEGLTAPEVRWLWLACRVAQDLWDDESWHALATRGVCVARETGALTLLPGMVNFLAALHVHSGEFASAAAVIDEVDALTEATGIAPLKYAATMLAASRGDPAQLQVISAESLPRAVARGEGLALPVRLAHGAPAQRERPVGEAPDPRKGVRARGRHRVRRGSVEPVEAGVHVGRADAATEALERLSERTQASGTEWALGIEAGSRALLREKQDAGPCTARQSSGSHAVVRSSTSLAPGFDTASGFGVRTGASTRANSSARAHEMFVGIGADAFAERARHELLATGETVRRRTDDARGVLTAQEAKHRSTRRKNGLSNPDSAHSSSFSPRTVEYHLRKIFLNLRSPRARS